MLLGIDYGTTRTVVAAVDRGNYPVISFHTENGDAQDWYPSLIAAREGHCLFGLDAAARQSEPGWLLLRSFKRQLGSLGPESEVVLGDRSFTALDLLTAFLKQLRQDLFKRSNLRIKSKDKLEAMISVPANSNSNQRFITMEAFRRADFHVRGVINEPSAAGIEYAHRYLDAGTLSRREHVVVYDLGGGTFDASVIGMVERCHEVITSEGIARLGGDDFDHILLDLALREAGVQHLSEPARLRLLEECREKKEGLHPNTRKVAIDLGRTLEGAGEVIVNTGEFYERCRPLIKRTVRAMERAMRRASVEAEVDGRPVAVYLVGGSTGLPVVARLLRERYERQVRKSPYPHAATAIGLAIAADSQMGYKLRERFTHHFGVWREAETGRAVALDVLFKKDTLLPERGQQKLTCSRFYRPMHNIGHFRYVECSHVDVSGQPIGDITPWNEIYFPFDPGLQNQSRLDRIPITRAPLAEQWIEEQYSCDEHGIIEVNITNHTAQFSRNYRFRERDSLRK